MKHHFLSLKARVDNCNAECSELIQVTGQILKQSLLFLFTHYANRQVALGVDGQI